MRELMMRRLSDATAKLLASYIEADIAFYCAQVKYYIARLEEYL